MPTMTHRLRSPTTPATDLLRLDKALLANLEWEKDFNRDNIDHCRLTFTGGRPFTTLIFGEIAPASMGTLHSCGQPLLGLEP